VTLEEEPGFRKLITEHPQFSTQTIS
jgi:hypothetical protein